MSQKSPSDSAPPSSSPSLEASAAEPLSRLIYRSSDLLKDRREIFIEHGHYVYRLRITSQGRLILTK